MSIHWITPSRRCDTAHSLYMKHNGPAQSTMHIISDNERYLIRTSFIHMIGRGTSQNVLGKRGLDVISIKRCVCVARKHFLLVYAYDKLIIYKHHRFRFSGIEHTLFGLKVMHLFQAFLSLFWHSLFLFFRDELLKVLPVFLIWSSSDDEAVVQTQKQI